MEETIKKLKPFWRQDGSDFIADLGIMKKAIVIRKCATDSSLKNTFYVIGQASYFPFTHDQYTARFEDAYDACMLAENHIKDWFKSLLVSENNMLESGNKLSEGNKQLTDKNN